MSVKQHINQPSMKQYTHLQAVERDQLYDLLQQGYRQSQIAKLLGRDSSTMSREIKRNRTSIERKFNNSPKKVTHYLPDRAQHKYEQRRQHSKCSYPLKNADIYKYVIAKLTSFEAWSPDAIAGRSQQDIGQTISHECIYQYIYSKQAQSLALWEYLRRAHKKRRRRHGRKHHQAKIPGRKDIALRPRKVAERKRFGDWEGDTIVGRGRGSAVHSELERISRLVLLEKLKRKTAREVERVMIKLFKPLPSKLKRTTTLDNGPEHVRHETVTTRTGLQIYFARPYASWQRGANEHVNGLVRWYFPKGTNFDHVTTAQLKRVQDAINNRPRKSLNYKKPIEIYSSILATLNEKIALEI